MTAAKALTWPQETYFIPTRVTGQTVVSSSRRLPVVRTETRGKITYLHFNISTNEQTMVKAWPAHIIERINPMPDEQEFDEYSKEVQERRKRVYGEPEDANETAGEPEYPKPATTKLQYPLHITAETAPQTASEAADAVPADDAPAAGEGVGTIYIHTLLQDLGDNSTITPAYKADLDLAEYRNRGWQPINIQVIVMQGHLYRVVTLECVQGKESE